MNANLSNYLPSPKERSLAAVIGGNLRRLRIERNLSLEKLAQITRVSRAMLGQIELGKSVPTITVLTRIAEAFGLPITAFIARQQDSRVALLPASTSKQLRTADGKFISRALFPFRGSRKVEFYELRLEPGCHYRSEPHAIATTEHLAVNAGRMEVELNEQSFRLDTGDAIVFIADVAHTYRNVGAEPVIAYLVMTYSESIKSS